MDNKKHPQGVFFVGTGFDYRRGFEGGAANESERFTRQVAIKTGRKAKSAIINCRAGRAAKGENPLLCAKMPRFRGFFIFDFSF